MPVDLEPNREFGNRKDGDHTPVPFALPEALARAGSGQAERTIDLPGARERATDYPFVPGSSIKGMLRDLAEHRFGLANTNPVATSGSTFGVHAPVPRQTVPSSTRVRGYARPDSPLEQSLLVQGSFATDVVIRPEGRPDVIEAEAGSRAKSPRPSGQIVLFKKIMEDWRFSEAEAATLLGYEAASNLREIYLGMKPISQRDANDRLRAVLRIAADLDALYRNAPAIRDWLNEPQHDLGGSTPRSLIAEGSMENLLRVKYYVAYLSGR